MTLRLRSIGSAALLLSLAAVVLAQAPALDVKMGLWEMTATSTLGGDMPMPDTSKMTPAQKAQVEAAMKEMMGTHNNVSKSCMTKEKFNSQNFLMSDDPSDKCKQVLTTNTKTALAGTVTCTGDNPMSGEFRADALSPTSVKVSMKGTVTAQGKAMNMTIAMTGKWLAADCGNVK